MCCITHDRAALAESGLTIAPRDVVTGGFSHDDGHTAARKLLSRKNPPTAIYAITDLIAFGVLDGARALGVSVPDDVWVVGFDNTDLASWESFDLTTVDQPVNAIVDAGVDLLRRRIADPSVEPTVLKLPCRLVIRGSTANAEPPPNPGDRVTRKS